LEEELNGVLVEFKRNGLEQRDEMRENLFISKVVAEGYDLVEVIVGKKEEHGGLLADVGDQNR
jgi:hypothetical protein